MQIPATQVPQELQADLNIVRDFLRERIVVQDVRIPHGKVRPKLQDGILTVVTRDEQRALPVVRLYCNETAAGLDSVSSVKAGWKQTISPENNSWFGNKSDK